MTEIPAGWVITSIGLIAETSLGKMLDAKRATGLHGTPYLRNINVRWGTFDLGDVASMDIRPDEIERVLARAGDLIVCEGGEPGRAAVWRSSEPIALQKALHKLRPATGVVSEFLAFLLRHQAASGELNGLFTGTTIKHIPQEKLRLVQVPLPPTREQERIVTAIEEAFSKLDAGEAGLRTVRQLLKRMREAVLGAAVTGRLVPQDPTETPATELLAELDVEQVHAPAASPAGWCYARLGSVAAVVSGNTPKGLDDAVAGSGDIPLIKVGDLALSEKYLTDSRTWLSRADQGRLRLRTCPAGTIVFPKRGGAIATNRKRILGREAAFDLNTMGLVPRSGLGEWIWTWFSQLDLRSVSDGSNVPQINHTDVAPLQVPIPPAAEQRRIVAEVERQFSFIGVCERAVNAGLTRASVLRQSVLRAAFEGRLAPQDSSDEPALELLARIHAERAPNDGSSGKRRHNKVEAS